MPHVTSIYVTNIRTHHEYLLELSPQVTLITGQNGSGKTSLIEAIYVALQGSSFKGSDAELLRHGQPWWRIDVIMSDETKRTVTFDPSKASGKKKFTIDGTVHYRLPARVKYPVVIFDPDDLRLLHGSPTRRRQFIDRFISQLDVSYGQALRKYDRALKQRNNLLKQAMVGADELFAWNVSLSEYGAYIITQRIRFIEELNAQLHPTYNTIAHSSDSVAVHYSHTAIDSVQQKLLGDLHAHTERDKLLGYTSVGPHRHDVLFDYNGKPALTVASRGEVRSIVLALKFIEVGIIQRSTGLTPVVLLDDVFSELDQSRQGRLVTETLKNIQLVITTTNSHKDSHPSALEIKLTE